MSERRHPGYQFPPLERRGLVGALRAGQTMVLAAGGAIGFVALLALPAGPNAAVTLVVVVIAVIVAFVPVGGLGLDEVIAIRAGFVARARSRRWRSSTPTAGFVEEETPAVDMPPELADLELLAVPVPGGRELGIVYDVAARTFVAIIAVQAPGSGLLDEAEQNGRLEAWGEVLAGMARDDEVIARVQWIERSVPGAPDELAQHLASNRDVAIALSSPAMRSYFELIDQVGAATEEHELLIAVQLDARRARRAVQRAVGDSETDQACELLSSELRLLAVRLDDAGLTVRGALTPALIHRVLWSAIDPGQGSALRHWREEEVPQGPAGPAARDEEFSCCRTDGAFHRTYWVAGWPRQRVGARFLQPLLLGTAALRAVSVVMEPVAPSKAVRAAERAVTSDESDRQLRAGHGFVETARQRDRQRSASVREEELVQGHAQMRYVGYVTVSALTREQLESSCAEVEQAGRQSRLELRAMHGQHAAGLTFTLPLCRGLA